MLIEGDDQTTTTGPPVSVIETDNALEGNCGENDSTRGSNKVGKKEGETDEDEKLETREGSASSRDVSSLFKKKVHRISLFLCWFLLAAASSYAVGRAMSAAANPQPERDLLAFAQMHHERNNMASSNASELPTDSFQVYAQAACLQKDNVESVESFRSLLAQLLRNIPEAARTRIVESAVLEGVTQRNSEKNTVTNFAETGKAASYLAFWSTKYSEIMGQPSYDTCIVASGIELEVGEVVAAFEVTTEKRQIGVEPCHCGLFYCYTCPTYGEVKTQTPILKRHSLTVEQQLALHSWMVERATESVQEALSAPLVSYPVVVEGSGREELDGMAWKEPKLSFHEKKKLVGE